MLKFFRILRHASELHRLLTRAVSHVIGNISRAKPEGHPDWQNWLADLDEIQDLLAKIEGYKPRK